MSEEVWNFIKAGFMTFIILGMGFSIFALGIFLLRIAVGNL